MRDADDPGPDWWPAFSWPQILRWIAEGFLLPLVATALAFVFGALTSFAFNPEGGFEGAIARGQLFVIVGLVVSGGAFTGLLILESGLKWKTAFRLAGFLPGIIAVWTQIVPLIVN